MWWAISAGCGCLAVIVSAICGVIRHRDYLRFGEVFLREKGPEGLREAGNFIAQVNGNSPLTSDTSHQQDDSSNGRGRKLNQGEEEAVDST